MMTRAVIETPGAMEEFTRLESLEDFIQFLFRAKLRPTIDVNSLFNISYIYIKNFIWSHYW